jgi:hypothetical protein
MAKETRRGLEALAGANNENKNNNKNNIDNVNNNENDNVNNDISNTTDSNNNSKENNGSTENTNVQESKHDYLDKLLEGNVKKNERGKVTGIYLQEDVSQILNRLSKKGGRGAKSKIVNESLRSVFKDKGLL